MQLSKALDSEYDALYSTSKDVLKKKEEILNDSIDRDAVELAADSINVASEKINREEEVEKRALKIVDEYKNQMNDKLYEKTKEEIVKKSRKKRTTQKSE